MASLVNLHQMRAQIWHNQNFNERFGLSWDGQTDIQIAGQLDGPTNHAVHKPAFAMYARQTSECTMKFTIYKKTP